MWKRKTIDYASAFVTYIPSSGFKSAKNSVDKNG
jgi:hypothetical protein